MRRFAAFLLLIGLFAAAAPAAAQTPEERGRLDWVQQRGRLLFEIDRAAWVTTDDLRARNGLTNEILGWTVERDRDGYIVVYYARGEGDALVAVYIARVVDRRVVSAELFPAGQRPPLTPTQNRIAAARGALRGVTVTTCTNSRPNIAVIPPDRADGPIDVYVLTAQTEAGVYPFGGHHLLTIGADDRVVSQRAFTNSCLNMTREAPGGGNVAALTITHLLDPVPTEIHVFMSIWVGLPLFVGIGGRVWEVTGDSISLVDDRN